MTFLAAMDILWNIEHASYQRMTRQMALEATVNLASLVFGPLTMVRPRRLRPRLASPSSYDMSARVRAEDSR